MIYHRPDLNQENDCCRDDGDHYPNDKPMTRRISSQTQQCEQPGVSGCQMSLSSNTARSQPLPHSPLASPARLRSRLPSSACWIRQIQTAVLVILLMVFYNNNIPGVSLVSAICSVKDETNKRLSMKKLPNGVYWDAKTNRFECKSPKSCHHWTIMGCSAVHCASRYACLEATLIGNQGVACWQYGSCQDADILSSHNVACGGGGSHMSAAPGSAINSCARATIETDTVAVCVGPYACVADWQDRTTFKVGKQGSVRCEGSGPDAYACQNIIVEVRDAERACVASNLYEKQKCAVVCFGIGVCDVESIIFKVVP